MIKKIGKAFTVIAALALLAMPAQALAHEEGEFHHGRGHDRGRHLGWYKHHQDNDLDDYAKLCDSDGDDCRPNPYFEGYRYDRYPGQSSYLYGNPSNYWYGNNAQSWRRRSLVNQDRVDRARYRAALARGDKKAQEHYLKQLNSTDRLLGMTQQQINGGMLPYANGYQASQGFGNGMVPLMQMFGF